MQKGGQDLPQGVKDRMRRKLRMRTGTHMKNRNDFREGVDGQPQPQHLFGTAQPSAQFIQLELWQIQSAKEALVQGVRVLARTRQKGS
jgi:hypothetical protein